jgi:hypothetical protein
MSVALCCMQNLLSGVVGMGYIEMYMPPQVDGAGWMGVLTPQPS